MAQHTREEESQRLRDCSIDGMKRHSDPDQIRICLPQGITFLQTLRSGVVLEVTPILVKLLSLSHHQGSIFSINTGLGAFPG